MPDNKWPLTFERIRGHWVGMGWAVVAAAWTLVRFAPRWPLAVAIALIQGFLSYWLWRAIDYTGWRVTSNYLPRRK